MYYTEIYFYAVVVDFNVDIIQYVVLFLLTFLVVVSFLCLHRG
jgi:hypothetical protein